MTLRKWHLPALAFSAVLLGGSVVAAADPDRKPVKELASFGTLQSPELAAAKTQALDWLKTTGKTDAGTIQAFDAIWANDRSLLDKVADTLALGDANVAKLLAESRDPNAGPPAAVPAFLKDLKVPVYVRANLALAYAKGLSNRRVYDDALEVLKQIKPEQVVDPGAYFFTRAVAEHTLMLKKEADDTIDRLLYDVLDSPERYRSLGSLMRFDMLTWQDKDLGWIARKMNVIKDRLEITRGGEKTQKMQKEVLVRLDEMIKEMENQQKSQGQGANGGNCPPGSNPSQGPPSNTLQPSSPQQDSFGGNGAGKGEVERKVAKLVEEWGNLPPKEQAKRMVEATKDLPEKYRESIETYLKQISARSAENK
jgi:hypothetical protein